MAAATVPHTPSKSTPGRHSCQLLHNPHLQVQRHGGPPLQAAPPRARHALQARLPNVRRGGGPQAAGGGRVQPGHLAGGGGGVSAWVCDCGARGLKVGTGGRGWGFRVREQACHEQDETGMNTDPAAEASRHPCCGGGGGGARRRPGPPPAPPPPRPPPFVPPPPPPPKKKKKKKKKQAPVPLSPLQPTQTEPTCSRRSSSSSSWRRSSSTQGACPVGASASTQLAAPSRSASQRSGSSRRAAAAQGTGNRGQQAWVSGRGEGRTGGKGRKRCTAAPRRQPQPTGMHWHGQARQRPAAWQC
jgi:hypothetical protein